MNSRATAELRLLRVAVEVDRIGPLRLFHSFAKRADERNAIKRPLNRPVHLGVSRRSENPRREYLPTASDGHRNLCHSAFVAGGSTREVPMRCVSVANESGIVIVLPIRRGTCLNRRR